MGALLPLLLPAIPSMIKIVEHLFGPKTGPAKLDTVVEMIKKLIPNIKLPDGVTAGAITDEQIKAAIETVLAQLKTTGDINTPLPSVSGTVPGDIWVGRGSWTKVNV